MPIAFRPFQAADMTVVGVWFGDADTARWVEPPNEAWVAHVTGGTRARAWIASRDGGDVGLVQADWDADRTAFVSLVVDPAQRGRGIGRAVQHAWLATLGRDFARVEGRIEPANVAAVRCALHSGFTLTSATPDEDGFLRLTFTPQPD